MTTTDAVVGSAGGVPVRAAATVVLVRDGPDGPEVLMLRRSSRSAFVPSAHVFPGGAVEPADATWEDTDRWRAAAVRECWEEVGVPLVITAGGEPVDAARLGVGRTVDAPTFVDALRSRGLRPDGARLRWLSRWVTPVGPVRRYATAFFVAPAPAGAVAAADGTEATGILWITPAGALERFRAGSMEMITPTVRTLEALAPFPSVASLLAALDAPGGLVAEDGGIRRALTTVGGPPHPAHDIPPPGG